ncbi:MULTISPECIES: phosphoethanolamine--lipid A transferase [unclassified Rhizobium]|uniref:phosphoethanolamine transferase n=1 Tax=unclassified Rhizobium TaxID=2613769 RepID=UPI00104D57AA|nr:MULTISPECIES: phosphoethanolamine--lipid A transferase [unclassified Rhizobium]MBB3397485.1 lipid A ethanolaminephosphotransferase [Rhizobium sp. BK060]MBB4169798.1 lipid A ethanolaminephosphotransferase [Rhizobium sp. BK538]TCM70658.1 lipid A ethanolaminephosphotransferase [Rhizobium sp. BK068]
MKDSATKARLIDWRPAIGSVTLCLVTTLYLLSVTNHSFWSAAYSDFAADHLSFVLFVIGISAISTAIITAFSAKYVTKPFLIFFVLAAAAGSWFTDQFGVIVDKEMIRNAAVSTGAEAGHLITARFVLHMLLTGILPSLLIMWLRIRHRPVLSKLAHNTGVILACLAVFATVGFGDYRAFAGVGRAHRDILERLNPFAPISSTIGFAVSSEEDAHVVAAPLGTDAHRVNTAGLNKPRVTIIVAGETARADDFSLGGYQRKTNPELEKQNVIYFPNTTSCGTATAISIPCMFSIYPRTAYTHRKGLATENLLDVLGHAKVDVAWLDNDTGSYHVTDRVAYASLPQSNDARFCKEGECLDAILLDKVDDWLDHVKGDSVLVLHQLGSHGPAYFARYPDEYRRFVPDCRANDFGSCTAEEITNAYDNTILYTDHVVSTVIDKLKQHSEKVAGAAIYVSDHGESLGENGIYLHGAPYIVAPSQQTHVPFLVWVGEDLAKSAGFEMSCMAKQTDDSRSHDNLFHSVLGLMDVATKVYDPHLDVFAACRRKTDKVASVQ